MSNIQRIRQKILDKDYYLSSHAEEEMAEDVRGTRYKIEGPTKDGRAIYVVCRFKESGNLIIITAYT